MEDVTLVGCFAHVRRGFTDALKDIKDKSSISSSVAMEGLKFCNKLFAIEKTLSGLTPKERYERRPDNMQEIWTPIMSVRIFSYIGAVF
ncbi:MAG: transposase [Candidatus Petromonas sp.]|nr:transposase [Candidatus Petromonas sp.]